MAASGHGTRIIDSARFTFYSKGCELTHTNNMTEIQPWLAERIERFRTFHASQEPGQIRVIMALWAMGLDYTKYGFEPRPLNSFDHENKPEEFVDHVLHRLRVEIEILKSLGDDTVPNVFPGVGIAPNSAFWTNAPMTVGPDTSWVDHILHDWDMLDSLRCDPSNKWFQVLTRMNRRFVECNEGDYTVMPMSNFSPMDMAHALRGNDLFMDFYDSPDRVHKLLDRCVEAVAMYHAEQKKIVPDVLGGTAIWGTWVPGTALFMSEDIADLCSPEIYDEFGRPHSEQLAARFGGCWIHHHARGLHVHHAIAKVAGLKQMEISWDPNCPRPIDMVEKLYEWSGAVPVMTRGTSKDLYDNIEKLKQGRFVFSLHARDLDDAREAIAFARKHSK